MRGTLPEGLPDEVYDEIARLRVVAYDARLVAFQTVAVALIALGVAGLLLAWFGRIGPLLYTGSKAILLPSLTLIAAGVVHYVRNDRRNRRSMD